MSAILTLRETTGRIGGQPTGNDISVTPLNNIFDNVTFEEAASGKINYRAIDLYNSGDLIAEDVEIYMYAATSSADTIIEFGLSSPYINSTLSIVTEDVAPVGVSFAYYEYGSTLSLSNIDVGDYARIWLRRTVSIGADNTSNDIGTIAYSYA